MVESLTDIGISLVLLLSIARFRSVRGARLGNATAALALLCAAALALGRDPPVSVLLLSAAAGAGLGSGWLVAARIQMIQIPAMVAFQNGMGGLAALLVSFVELTRRSGEGLSADGRLSALLVLVVGAATFSGSMVATGKLAQRLSQAPLILPRHNAIAGALALILGLLMALSARASDPGAVAALGALIVGVSAAWGTVLSIRVGGADMPVLISFLNAASGIAAALCGVALGSQLLIVCGATVAASGSVLTHFMCVAMHRTLVTVLAGDRRSAPREDLGPAWLGAADGPGRATDDARAAAPHTEAETGAEAERGDPLERALAIARAAKRVIVIPGYGMALADAQEEVARLAERLKEMGKDVVFAVHPVAGRMPGHMHVLLAEAEVDYASILELEDVNPRFAETDLSIVVGACDVVNPAAMRRDGTPISGMPILRAHESRSVIVCNLDDRPGYSGVENPLYRDRRTILLLGDAKETLHRLLAELEGSGPSNP